MNKYCVLALLFALSISGCSSTPTPRNDATVLEHPDQFLVIAVQNDTHSGSIHVGSTARGYDAGNAYLQSARARKLLRDIARDYQLQSVQSWPIQVLSMQCVVFKPVNNAPTNEIIEKLQHDPRVMLAQQLNSFMTNTAPAADHSIRDVQHTDNYAALQHSMERMEVIGAHQWSQGQGINIAVIDTGMDIAHPDLKGRIRTMRNFVNGDPSLFEMDRHGTEVAGVMAANLSNHAGITGVAPGANLVALKACWQLYADRDEARCNSFTLAQALASAIELHVNIINLSVVGPDDILLSALVKRAQKSGIIVVGAMDSDGHAGFPAIIPDVIAVSAMEQPSEKHVNTITAPGRDVLTLLPGGRYDFSSGSSIATAEVSGTVALILATPHGSKLNGEQVHQLLMQSTETSATDKLSSVNACLALSQLMNQQGCERKNMETSRAVSR